MRHESHVPTLRAIRQDGFSHPKSALSILNSAKPESSTTNSWHCGDTAVVGGIFSDCGLYWIARDASLVIASSKSQAVVAIYNFNNAFRDTQFKVNTCQIHEDLVIVGLRTEDGRGCVAVYKPLMSKVVKAIAIPYPVTSLEIITCSGGAITATRNLHKNLRYLFGIVAVGTEEGHVYLVDLKLDVDERIGSLPEALDLLQPASRNVPNMRENAASEHRHLAFELQASSHEEGVFHFSLPDDEILESFYPNQAAVTSMRYESRVASVFVGFRFGQFQIFSLQKMRLVYSSEYESNTAPVLQFAFQEPENDPRKYCYLWVAKGNEKNTDKSIQHPLTVSMFQLGYVKKELTPCRGPQDNVCKNEAQYGNFEVCCQRFQHILGSALLSNASQSYGASLLMCHSIEKYSFHTEHHDTVDVEYGSSPSSSFCVFGWRSYSDGCTSQLHTLVFDINRWYMAQMPHRLCGNEDDYLYVGYWSFDNDAVTETNGNEVLCMSVAAGKIRPFSSGRKPLPEKFIFPSACSFTLDCLTERMFYSSSMNGHQRQVLNAMRSANSMCLVSPQEIHDELQLSGLFTTLKRNQALSPDMMRENMFTAALEHGQISFLLTVIKELATGHLVACGCTIKFVMEWAWKSVAHIKSAIDDLSIPIFDCSTAILDVHIKNQLWFNTTLMYHLRIVFQKMLEYTENATEKSKEELNTKLSVTTLIYQYLKAVQWFISNGFLPEQLEGAENEDDAMTPNGIFIYKYTRLRQVFDQRRNELKRLECPDLLLIDGWIEAIGEPLTSRWEKSDEGKPNYPPPNIMTLLDTYYLDCVDITTKHCLVMYLLNDLVAMLTTLQSEDNTPEKTLCQNRLEKVMGYLQSFNVPTGLVKLTQGFWLLDHKHFEEALNILLDPGTSQAREAWQQRRILRAFLYQHHPAMALKYLSVCQPKLETVEDVKMHITIYITNRDVLKAWDLVQRTYTQYGANHVFSHLFTLSREHSSLDQLLKLPLTNEEESMVVKYMQQSEESDATQILVLFYLQRNRYLEAIKLHSQTKHIRLMRDQSEESRRLNARLGHLIQAYTNVLPKVERDLLLPNGRGLFTQRAHVRKEVHKLPSLPAVLRPASNFELRSKSDIIARSIDKMEETRNSKREPTMTPLRRRPFPRSSQVKGNTSGYRANALRRSSIGLTGVIERSKPELPSNVPETPKTPKEPAVRRERRLSTLSAAAVLLQTPPIIRRKPSVQNEFSAPTQTPQSILKVRPKLLKRDRECTPSPPLSGHARQDDKVDECDNIDSDAGDSYKIISDVGLESADDTMLGLSWQHGPGNRLHSTTIESESFFRSLDTKDRKNEVPSVSTPHFKRMKRDPLIVNLFGDGSSVEGSVAAEPSVIKPRVDVPVIKTPYIKRLKRDPLICDLLEDSVEESSSEPRPPMISTPTIVKTNLRKFELDPICDDESMDNTRKIRFAGLDSSANESNLSIVEHVSTGQVEGSTLVRMKAEESDDMEVDVMGDVSNETGQPHMSHDPELPEQILAASEGVVADNTEVEDTFNSCRSFQESIEIQPEPDAEQPAETATQDTDNDEDKSNVSKSDDVVADDETADDLQLFISPESSDVKEPGTEISGENIDNVSEDDIIEVPSSDEDDAIAVTSQYHIENEEDVEPGLDLEAPDSSASDVESALVHSDEAVLKEELIAVEDDADRVSISDPDCVAEGEDVCEEFVSEDTEDENLHLCLSDADEDLPFEECPAAADRISAGDSPDPGVIAEDIVSEIVSEVESQRTGVEMPCDPEIPEENEVDDAKIPIADPVAADDVRSVAKDVHVDLASPQEEMVAIPGDGDETLQKSESAGCKVEILTDTPVMVTRDPPGIETPLNVEVPETTEQSEVALRKLEDMEEAASLDENAAREVDTTMESPSKGVAPKIEVSEPPSLSRVQNEPVFVLSPPTTRQRRKNRVDSSTQCTPKLKARRAAETRTRPTRESASKNVPPATPAPAFVFSPPVTRTRSARKNKGTVEDSSAKSTHLLVPGAANSRSRRKTRSSDLDGEKVSPTRRSPRRAALSERDSDKSMGSPVRPPSSTPEVQQSVAKTPPRRGRPPGSGKTPGTPTRSSKRLKAKVDRADDTAAVFSEPELPAATLSSPFKKARMSKRSISEDNSSAEARPKTPTRRSVSAKVKSPLRKNSQLSELSPLREEDEKNTKFKKRRQTPTMTARSSASYTTRTRRKVRISETDQKK